MPDDRDSPVDDVRTSVERIIGRDLDDLDDRDGRGRPITERARHSRRSIEAYLKAGNRPRWMERVADIDRGIAQEQRRVGFAYRSLHEECGHDRARFAERWRAQAEAFSFDALNVLIGQHNAWYPIERDLPMDIRTRDYVKVQGRSYRRPVLGPGWVLEQFPAEP